MALRSNETLEAFVDKITRNSDIMQILKLPTIFDKDSDRIKKLKRKLLIDKFISKTAQEPVELGKKFQPLEIDNVIYEGYGNIRITVSLAQSIKTDSNIFGQPQVDINIYYDNTELNNVFKLLDLISDEFSGQNLVVKIEHDKQMIKDIKCEVITSQIAIINNYERVGMRFSFYSTLYKN